MGINLSTDLRNAVSFRSTETTEPKKTDLKPEIKTSPLEKQPARDDFTAPVSMKTPETPKKAKTGPIQGFKNFIAGCKKLFNNIAEYGKGIIAGVLGGAVIGGASFGALGGINFAKRSIDMFKGIAPVKPEQFKLIASTMDFGKRTFEAMSKALGKAPKGEKLPIPKHVVIGVPILLAAGTLIKSVFDASLNASEKNAKVEDRWMGRDNSVKAHK